MTHLTQAQRLVLTSACEHDLGLATRPAQLKPAQLIRMTAFFVEHQYAKEIGAKAASPVWREDKDGRRRALKILKAGRAAVEPLEDAGRAISEKAGAPLAAHGQGDGDSSFALAQSGGPKSRLIVDLMQRSNGATIEELAGAAGWLPHTTRAALSGLRKKGVVIERRPTEQGRASVYRILPGSEAA